MTPMVTRTTYAVTASQQDPVRRTTSMATATVVKPQTVAKATKAHRYAALRLEQAQQAAIRLKHVSNPTRLQIILMLAEGEKHAGWICEVLKQRQPATSHHLALLRLSGM